MIDTLSPTRSMPGSRFKTSRPRDIGPLASDRMKPRLTAAALTIASLSLVTACSPQANTGSPALSAPPAASTTVEGTAGSEPAGDNLTTWVAADGKASFGCFDQNTGVEYTIPLPVDMSDPRIVAVEDLRTKAGAAPINYLLVEIDATDAHAPGTHGLWGAEWATTEQKNGSAKRLVNSTNSPQDWPGWDGSAGSPMPEMLEVDANTGAKGFALLAADEPIESMVAPSVVPGATLVPCARS